MRFLSTSLVLFATAVLTATSAGCAAETSDGATTGEDQNVTADTAATLKLTSDFQTTLTGQAVAGQAIRIEYALERLPQCRGNSGGAPGWNISGFYSENGGAAKSFEVTALTPDGKDRVAKAARIVPANGGDLAVWFQVTSRFGCSEYDSQYSQNFHVPVKGAAPVADASIAFGQTGAPKVTGELKAGGSVKVTYEQDRLPDCRRSQGGHPMWTVTGFAQVDRETSRTFDTGRPEGSSRTEIDAIIQLPHAGELSLWFQTTDVGGCMKYDAQSGANYKFPIAD
jgi:hypothetical protein